MLDLAIVIAAFFLYSVVRTFSGSRVGEAMSNSMSLIDVEQKLGLFIEQPMQEQIISSWPLIKFFNGVYAYGHMPPIIAVGLALFFFNRPHYILFRNAILISGAIGLIIFNVFPMAPPRLISWPNGLVDTLSLFSEVNYHSGGNFINHYAAMPSLHVAWNLLICLAVVTWISNIVVRAAAMMMPLFMSIAVVVTGNHFLLDVFAGYAVAAMGLGLALAYRDHGWRVWHAIPGTRRQAATA